MMHYTSAFELQDSSSTTFLYCIYQELRLAVVQ